ASSVSPERWLSTALYLLRIARFTASNVSESVPIWLTFTRIELAAPVSMPLARNSLLVTNRSSPTSWTFSPSLAVSFCQPSQSFSARPSSIDRIGYLEHQSAQMEIMSSLEMTLLGSLLKKQ